MEKEESEGGGGRVAVILLPFSSMLYWTIAYWDVSWTYVRAKRQEWTDLKYKQSLCFQNWEIIIIFIFYIYKNGGVTVDAAV